MNDLSQNLQEIESKILAACSRSGRKPTDIRVLLASKTVSPERLREAYQLGYTLYGENKAQELLEKLEPLKDLPLEWHFIGHLQSNKVKDVVGACSLIHSVDRLSLAQEISKRSEQKEIVTSVLIEVNTSGEESKSGVSPENALELCRQVSLLPHLQIEGLMTLATNTTDEAQVRGCFKMLRDLSLKISKAALSGVQMKHLSMGMSQDYAWAIEEGSTLIRIGSAAFGARSK